MPMMEKALQKPESRGVLFSLADAGQLPFEDATFDLVTISFATRNLNTSRAHLLQCFREFHRVLKPGGRFVNLETSQPENGIMRKLVHSYVFLLVRPIGKFISGSGAGYSYLSRTIPRFYPAPELKELLLGAGFSEVSYDHLLVGVAAIHRAVK
jgi:demethylmenaquinone methyltransferase/2-methoxy-6-polyprenyl-1,4-benzoquinol methylase